MKVFADSLQHLERVLDHGRARQAVLSSNVANVDTPNYRAQDLEKPSFDDQLSLAMTKTTPGHLDGDAASRGPEVQADDDQAPRVDGNTVSLERQMAKLEQNRVRYGAASAIVSRRLALLRYAATDGQ